MTFKRPDITRLLGGARPFGPAIAIAAIGIALSLLAWLAVASWENRLAKQDLARAAEDHAQTLQTGLAEYTQKLVALRAFFNGSQHGVTRKEFNVFTEDLLDERKAILSFSWIPRITREERAKHELEGVFEGIPGYEIKSVGLAGRMSRTPEQDEYFPVFYSKEPLSARIYGINLRDGGVRQRPLDRARDSDQLAASGNFRLQTGTGSQDGFFVVLPVYRAGLPHDTVDERRLNLVGFVTGVFQFNVMVDAILANVKSPLKFWLFDASGGTGEMPVHVRGEEAGAPFLTKSEAMAVEPSWIGDLTAGDRHWQLVATPAKGRYSHFRHDRAWIVLCAGLVITGLMVAYIWNSIRLVRRLQTTNEAVSVLALTDALTGLPNRRSFFEEVTSSFGNAASQNRSSTVHFLDLDGFKEINDTQGHAAGDELLREVATRLRATVRTCDLVSRFGGDEFAILQADAVDSAAAGVLAEKVLAALAAPYFINGVELHITASIGIAPHSTQTEGAKAIMMQADLALYRAKADGGNCFRFHSGELDQQVHLRVTLARELRTAIERHELELYYQTQVEIRSGRIVGLEALIRWNHPTRGAVPPSIFIPIAEQTGAITVLGKWVLEQACRQFREWQTEGLCVPRLGINVSGGQLARPSEFERDVAESFTLYRIPSRAIEFELTESVLMEVTTKQSDALDRLRRLGASIAIDDFGTGYSSLKYLTTYPVDRLKIAQELIAGIPADPRSAVVVQSSIGLAHDLGIEVIAEGVERADQAKFLLEAGCEYAQGYHYTRPMPADKVARLMLSAEQMTPKNLEVHPTSSAA